MKRVRHWPAPVLVDGVWCRGELVERSLEHGPGQVGVKAQARAGVPIGKMEPVLTGNLGKPRDASS